VPCIGRTSKVVGGIIVASSAVGALAGIITAALIALVFGATRELLNPAIYGFAGSIGAACGAVLGPAFAFGFMRRVPLGRLFAETGAGTVVGGLAGLLLPLGLTGIGGIAAAGAAGFVVAAARLAWIYRRRGEPAALPPAA
jgi:hypothetical protein